MYDFKNDLYIILKVLNISIHELAYELDFDVPTISNWLNGKCEPDRRSKEDVYEYAYKKGLRINLAYERPFTNLGNKQNFKVLYHGSKQGIIGDISLDYSKDRNDFGKGFYCGETYEQSVMFVCDYKKSNVMSYGLYTNKLNVYEYNIDSELMLIVAYNRGLLKEYENSNKLKTLISKSKNADIIIAPIANNRMFAIIEEFVNGMISDEACCNALAALDLGKQYVLKTDKAIGKLGFLKEYYLCDSEKESYKQSKMESLKQRQETINNFRSKYRQGKYIEELL